MDQALDLRGRPPRRWSDELEGVRWLPRLIDKARAAKAGTLGAYLYGQSPIDIAFLRELGLSHREFLHIVEPASSDADVVASLRTRDPERFEAARRWSKTEFTRRFGWCMWFYDLDDGYAKSPFKLVVTPLADAGMALVKRIWPKRYV